MSISEILACALVALWAAGMLMAWHDMRNAPSMEEDAEYEETGKEGEEYE